MTVSVFPFIKKKKKKKKKKKSVDHSECDAPPCVPTTSIKKSNTAETNETFIQFPLGKMISMVP